MPQCWVYGCRKTGANSNTHMHIFPFKDLMGKEWVVKYYRSDRLLVCSQHLEKKTFEI